MTYLAKPTPKVKVPKPLRSRPHVIPPFIRELVFERDGYLCQNCKEPGGALDAHHRLARSAGGSDAVPNLVSLHRKCHRYVHEHPSEARRRGLIVAAGAKD